MTLSSLVLPPAWRAQLPRHSRIPGERPRILHPKEVERRIFQLTNEVRRKNHLPPLDSDNALVATARAHSDDMLTQNFFTPCQPGRLRTASRTHSPAYSRTLSRIGENILGRPGFDYSDSKTQARVIVDSWMTSPGHRANILNPNYTHLGVGVGGQGQRYVTPPKFLLR